MSTTEADTASTVAATCGDSIESSAGVEVAVDVDGETHTGDIATSAAQLEETITNTATATATDEAPSFVAQLLQSVPSVSDLAAQLQTDPAVAAFAAFHDSLKDKDNNEDKDKRDSSLDNAAELPKYNWDALSAAFEHIYTLYADEVAAVLADVDRLDIRRAIWHESAFRMDGERASRLFKNTEAWVASSEAHLLHQREGLAASVQTIRNTLADLSK